MRIIRFFLIGLVLLAANAWAQQEEDYFKGSQRGDQHSKGWDTMLHLRGGPLAPRFPTLGKDVERIKLDNGMILYLKEDRQFPLVRAEALIRTGAYYETKEEQGFSGVAARLIRSGGTASISAQDFDDRLAKIAALFSVSAGDDRTRASLDVLSQDIDEGLRLFADALLHPAFDADRLSLEKRRLMFGLRAMNDAPGLILNREFNRLLYTEAHPDGRSMTPERVTAMSREDLVRFHSKYFRPNNVMLAIVGDFDKGAMLEKIKSAFAGWAPAPLNLPALPKVATVSKPGVYCVPKPVNQSNVLVGHWGIDRTNPDRFAITLMNRILGGGGFSSRLTERVRSDEGLAYSVSSSFPGDGRDVGMFRVSVQTKTESTLKAVDSILDEIRKMKTGQISKNEFETAKESLIYSYVFQFGDAWQTIQQLMALEFEGLPADYYEKTFEGYKAVTPRDIERAARKYLRPEDLTIFIVGDYDKFSSGLSKFGTVSEIKPLKFETVE